METTKKSSEILNKNSIGQISDQELMLSNIFEYQQFILIRGHALIVANGYGENYYDINIIYNLDSIEIKFRKYWNHHVECNIVLTKHHLALNDNDWQDYIDAIQKERIEKERIEKDNKAKLEFKNKLELYNKLREELGFIEKYSLNEINK